MGIYIVVAVFFLSKEYDDLFKIVLLMPVIIMALKYGVRMALFTALVLSSVLFMIGYFKHFIDIDADIVFSSVLFLLAWLLGNMTETEYSIRTELERLATHDGLTDIYNHRSFQNLLDQELEKAQKENNSVSLILLDIDYFKYYNDAYGHQEGDRVLVSLAQILKETVGKLGYCARYGGEEFGVILPGIGIHRAKDIGEAIRRRIEESNFPGVNVFPKGKLTASIGIAEFPLNANNKEKLIKKADEALYRAKFVSKNRVESYYSVFDEVSLPLKEEEKELFNSISAFTMVINAKDRYTYGHSLRVMEMAKNLSLRMEVEAKLIQEITFGALLHDIGKVEISREVLNKPGKLNENEWNLLKMHPVWGADIVDPLKSFYRVKEIILYHHENYDGTGYPSGICGEDIPLGARILRIVDSYDAMTTDRPYKAGMSLEQALEELDRYSGTHYDAVLLKEFKKMVLEMDEAQNQLS
ncbi:diguanylate cyclase [Candidatus Formimonas warabiya]|uniref:bifunctional diguanylate cyclase/phosphohydrolase n=1 Tax=Formimonas warabiya TaxID=1761012 RepID=UPI001BE4977C|nr:diguanylate cyclase [Candidatus Formimonas warabiya]